MKSPLESTPSVLLVAGSPSASSRSAALLDYLDGLLRQAGYVTDKLSVRDLPPKALLHADFEDPLLRGAQKRVAQSSAVVLATPVYKAAYSGILKAFLDLLPQDALAGKTALAIVTGGNAEHLALTDFAVRRLFTALCVSQVLPTVFALHSEIAWNAQSALRLDRTAERQLQDRALQLRERLSAINGEVNPVQSSDPVSDQRCEVGSS